MQNLCQDPELVIQPSQVTYSLPQKNSQQNFFKIFITIVVFNGSKIVVYGGEYHNANTPYYIPSKETIVMLDTITLIWSKPPVGNIEDIPMLTYHTATVQIDRIMFIAFGELHFFF